MHKLHWRKAERNTTVLDSVWATLLERPRAEKAVMTRDPDHAHIKICYYTVYRDYQLHNVSFMTPRKLRDHKERILKDSDLTLLPVK